MVDIELPCYCVYWKLDRLDPSVADPALSLPCLIKLACSHFCLDCHEIRHVVEECAVLLNVAKSQHIEQGRRERCESFCKFEGLRESR
jgi:hypothetical protein